MTLGERAFWACHAIINDSNWGVVVQGARTTFSGTRWSKKHNGLTVRYRNSYPTDNPMLEKVTIRHRWRLLLKVHATDTGVVAQFGQLATTPNSRDIQTKKLTSNRLVQEKLDEFITRLEVQADMSASTVAENGSMGMFQRYKKLEGG